MKITVQIEDRLLAKARKRAANTGETLKALIENGLRRTLADCKLVRSRRRFRVRTSGKGGLQPGVDLNNSAALLDIMEGIEDHT